MKAIKLEYLEKDDSKKITAFCEGLVAELSDYLEYGKYTKCAGYSLDHTSPHSIDIYVYDSEHFDKPASADAYLAVRSAGMIMLYEIASDQDKLDAEIKSFKKFHEPLEKKHNELMERRRKLFSPVSWQALDNFCARAKRKINDEWVYGFPVYEGKQLFMHDGYSLLENGTKQVYVESDSLLDGTVKETINKVYVDERTVGFCTGMSAGKNLVHPKHLKIYSNDIISAENKWIDFDDEEHIVTIRGTIEWENGGFLLRVFNYKQTHTCEYWYLDMLSECNNIVIEGNVVDNPEMFVPSTKKKVNKTTDPKPVVENERMDNIVLERVSPDDAKIATFNIHADIAEED